MRIMGLDYGSKTIGVAISDPLLITAQGIEIIRRDSENKIRKSLARIEELIAEYEVNEIVLGYPKNMDDTIGERARKTEEFKDRLERRTGLNVILWDERLTTVAAEEIMIESGIRRENRSRAGVPEDGGASGFVSSGYAAENGAEAQRRDPVQL